MMLLINEKKRTYFRGSFINQYKICLYYNGFKELSEISYMIAFHELEDT
jgi:hypothetical protein